MKTNKLFRLDPYQTSCTAKVTSKDGTKIQLDQTVFFAFAGGQASDYGTIAGIPVIEAKCEGQGIVYTLENEPPFSTGDDVKVVIDGERRKKLMKLHSAAHILYFLFEEKTGIKKLIGSNVDLEKARLDYAIEKPITELLAELEKKANELINKNAEIKTFPDDKKPDLWWWESNNWKCPCGGTHPRTMGEIGKIKLKRKNLGAGKERIEIYSELI